MTITDNLNTQFGIADHVSFQNGNGNLPKAVITNQFATAEVYLHGAHVTAYQPHDAEPIIWMSSLSPFQTEAAIRGGIPVVWPWFGSHPTDERKPQHGFVRTMAWSVVATAALPDRSTQLRLQVTDNEATRAMWPHAFELELAVTVGPQLRVDLISRNTGTDLMTVGGALHTYFTVGNIDEITIAGLNDKAYLDKPDNYVRKEQSGPIHIMGEVDRVYLDTVDECTIIDLAMARKIHVAKAGSRTTVVWNPWRERAAQMADLPNDGYRTMVCVETVNAVDDVYQVRPGAEHLLSQIVSVS